MSWPDFEVFDVLAIMPVSQQCPTPSRDLWFVPLSYAAARKRLFRGDCCTSREVSLLKILASHDTVGIDVSSIACVESAILM